MRHTRTPYLSHSARRARTQSRCGLIVIAGVIVTASGFLAIGVVATPAALIVAGSAIVAGALAITMGLCTGSAA